MGIIGALLYWFFVAKASVGWSGVTGFKADRWPDYSIAFWATFWAGTVPTIVTAALIAVSAGVYI